MEKNGYNLSRKRFEFRYSNSHKCKALHTELYFYIIDLWNRLGQKDVFGLPTQMTMEILGVGSYNTYNKAYLDLVGFGFIKEVEKSKNQHTTRRVAISNIDKATDEALYKATYEATDKAHTKATDTIDKQINKGTKEQINKYDFFSSYSKNFIDTIKEYDKIRKPKTKIKDMSIKQLEIFLKKLKTLGQTEDGMIAVLENSIVGGYQGIFEIKKGFSKEKPKMSYEKNDRSKPFDPRG